MAGETGQIKVNHGAVGDTTAKLASEKEAIEEPLGSLEALFPSLFVAWQGSAASACDQVVAKMVKDLKESASSLGSFGEGVKKADAVFAETDEFLKSVTGGM